MKPRAILLTLLAILMPLVFVGVVAEVFVRVAFDEKLEYTLEMWKYARYAKRIASDPRVGHEHVPGARARLMGVDVEINSKGLRDREFPHEKPKDTVRVLMLGDSLAFGWGVAVDKTTSKQLEVLLNAQAKAASSTTVYEVINTGVGNYNTQMEIQYFFNEGVKYDPDIVVLNYFINDAEPTPSYTGHFFNENFQSWVYFAGRLDLLMRGKAKKDWRDHYRSLYDDDAPAWLATKESMRRLGAWCRENDVPCVLINQPELHELQTYPFVDVNTKLEAAAREANLRYVDLLPTVQGKDESTLWVTVPDPHPNALCDTYFTTGILPVVSEELANRKAAGWPSEEAPNETGSAPEPR
jgi:hypothetical protein